MEVSSLDHLVLTVRDLVEISNPTGDPAVAMKLPP
jgi:hypothetical protein